MSTPPSKPPRDAEHWAQTVSALHAEDVPEGAVSLVEGKRLVGPIQGFGKMWQKTYRVKPRGAEVSPADVIREWKENFPSFWPQGNELYAPITGIKSGEVALIKATVPGGLTLSTGVMVLYADEKSFTLMTPQRHLFAGWITFSAAEEDGATVAQAQVLMRARDPLVEIALRLGGHRKENEFWEATLRSLAAHVGVEAEPETRVVCVDKRRQWSQVTNVWHSAPIRSSLHALKPRRRSKTAG